MQSCGDLTKPPTDAQSSFNINTQLPVAQWPKYVPPYFPDGEVADTSWELNSLRFKGSIIEVPNPWVTVGCLEEDRKDSNKTNNKNK